MDNQKTQNCGQTQQGMKQGEEGIKQQDKPSHMNQGDRTFRPDQEKRQDPSKEQEHRKDPGSSQHQDQGSGQHHEQPARKAS